MIYVTQSLSRPGGLENEDGIWYEDGFAALMDGASSLVPSPAGGRWLVQNIIQGLKENPTQDLPDRVNRAIKYAENRPEWKDVKNDSGILPSAAGIFVQEKEDDLEILSFGDCSGFFFMEDGEIITITNEDLRELDQSVFDLCRRLQAESGKTIAELMKTAPVRQLLISNRLKMNQPDGYRTLAFNMIPCEESEIIRLPLKNVTRFVLCSDGFETMGKELLDPEVSLEELYQALRQQEADDPDFELVPRFKMGDDASALTAEIRE